MSLFHSLLLSLTFVITLCAHSAQAVTPNLSAHIEYATSLSQNHPSGNSQSDVVGHPLKEPFRVQVLDSAGNPLSGIPVSFSVAATPAKSHDAHVWDDLVLTDDQGKAHTKFVLGSKAGNYVVAASIPDSISQPNAPSLQASEHTAVVYFNAKGRPSNWVFLMMMGLFGGLALFLFGMEMMSEGMKKSAGDRLRSILAALTNNRFIALSVGAFVTMLIQSSSATTVMLVSFVQAGLMNFTQSLCVILGADIGTTVTAQLIAFKLTDYALLMIAAGFALFMFSRRETLKYIGEVILGFGILFYGMHLMSDAMYPLRSHAGFIDLLLQLKNPLLGILIGAIFTAVIQSSSAFTGIIIVLAQQGLLTLEAGIPLLLGANIGTCITAALASISTGREAKRVALAHTLFKVAGVLLFAFWIPTFAQLIERISPKSALAAGSIAAQSALVPRQVANAHTIFNISLALLFLPFTALFARVVTRLLPDGDVKPSDRIATWHLKESALDTPAVAIDLARAEIQRMMKIVHRMLDAVLPPFLQDGDLCDNVHADLGIFEGLDLREKKVDFLDEKITKWLMKISKHSIPSEQAGELFGMMSIVNDLESVADAVHRNIETLAEKKQALVHDFSAEGKKELQFYHVKVLKQMARLETAFLEMDHARAKRMVRKEEKYLELEKAFRQAHFERVTEHRSESIATHTVHMELIDLLKQINLHQGNMARTLIGHMEWERSD
jgi:phosphate:Na+ symporter